VPIDNVQPYYASVAFPPGKGHVPEAGMAQLYLEFENTNDAIRGLDIALKAAHVHPGMLQVTRSPGKMEVHSFSRTDIAQAGEALLAVYGPEDVQLKPKIHSADLITNVDEALAELISAQAGHGPVQPGQSLFVLEVVPTCYAALACNEAEKHAGVDCVRVNLTGRTGFYFAAGSEEDIKVARDVVLDRLARVPGRE